MSIEEVSAVQMGQCAVTGKIVPEDELVTIQGQRVCAEGKAILLERLRAGEALPGELERPTVLRRFGCIFLDAVLLWVVIFAFSMIIGFGFGAASPVRGGRGGSLMAMAAAGFVGQTIWLLYFGLMHGARGQTLGKSAGKLIVVNLDGSPITMGTAFLRALAYCGPGYLQPLAMLTLNQQLMFAANAIFGVYAIVNVIVALVDSAQQRSIHDRIAGTRVVVKA
jgi:uncharacterized RDD family membrane protein YckC